MNEVSPLAELAEMPAETSYQSLGDGVVPWRFGSFEDDYSHLRSAAGAIDLSASGLVRVAGPQAEDVLDETVARDVSYMTPERTVMGMILDADGSPVDTVIVYRTEHDYVVVTSVGRGDMVLQVLRRQAEDRADVVDGRAAHTLIGLEGPKAVELVEGFLDEPLEGLPFQGARTTTWRSRQVMVSRTGVTGEFGFTFLVACDDAAELWRALTAVGPPVGFEALECAMIEVRQPLLHREVLEGDTVISAGLNWLIDIDKESFLGRDAVMAQVEAGTETVRLSIVSASPLHRAARLELDGEAVGDVVHAVRSPGLDAWCGVARVQQEIAVAGLELTLADGSGSVRSVSSPMMIPTSWHALRG